jgi:hypothetical protein
MTPSQPKNQQPQAKSARTNSPSPSQERQNQQPKPKPGDTAGPNPVISANQHHSSVPRPQAQGPQPRTENRANGHKACT